MIRPALRPQVGATEEESMELMTQTLGALAEPSRMQIVEFLRDGPRAVNDIVARLGISQPQVSKHLRVLKEARLVEVTPQAQRRLYALRPQPLRELHDWLEGYRQIWDARFDALQHTLDALTQEQEP
jgi:DNA-binding transcriptional ArsR family regulator